MSGVATAVVGAAVVGSAVTAESQKDAARKQGQAVEAAGHARAAQLARATETADEGLSFLRSNLLGSQAINQATDPAQLRHFDEAIGRQSANLQRQEQLFASLDPSVMEASQQALSLLRGEESKSLGPLKKQRAGQRQKLIDRLRAQLGPGAETSTAGIQALNQFDQQTDTLFSNAQQQTLGQLFSIGQTGAVNRGALNAGAGQLGSLVGQRSNALSNMATTEFGRQSLLQTGFANKINAQTGEAAAAGAGAAGRMISAQGVGQANAQFGQTISNLGGIALGSMMGGAGGAGTGATPVNASIRQMPAVPNFAGG